MFEHWYTDYVDDDNKPVRDAAKAAWDCQQYKIDEIEKENAKLRVLIKEAKSLIKDLCQTYNNPFPDASFERFNEALKD